MSRNVTVWGEDAQELWPESVAPVEALYPGGIHTWIAGMLSDRLATTATVRTSTFNDAEHGLDADTLAGTDVLVWWSHLRHDDLPDECAQRVRDHVLAGMGLIVLHSAIESKPFKLLMGTSCTFARWRDADDREVVWTVNPSHPITEGVPEVFVIPKHEMYSEFFDIPAPDELVFISSFTGGEVFRSGGCFRRGRGRIFYFSPGHETEPVYHQDDVQRVLTNAVGWACPLGAERIHPTPPRRALDATWFDE